MLVKARIVPIVNLGNLVWIMEYKEPTASNLSKQAVDRLAADVARQVGFQSGDDISPIVQKLGGRIQIRDLSEVADPSSGSIFIRGPREFDIVLPSHTGLTRDRFTIAHELGHLVLHYIWPRHRGADVGPTMARRYGTGRVEWEANWFAAGFLMPAEDFKEFVRTSGSNTALLSVRYGVSPAAAEVRLRSLNLL